MGTFYHGPAVGMMVGMDAEIANQQIALLVDKWCERLELGALADILPSWLGNNGLTDGWDSLGKARRSASGSRRLPDDERDLLKKLWVEIDYAVHNR